MKFSIISAAFGVFARAPVPALARDKNQKVDTANKDMHKEGMAIFRIYPVANLARWYSSYANLGTQNP